MFLPGFSQFKVEILSLFFLEAKDVIGLRVCIKLEPIDPASCPIKMLYLNAWDKTPRDKTIPHHHSNLALPRTTNRVYAGRLFACNDAPKNKRQYACKQAIEKGAWLIEKNIR